MELNVTISFSEADRALIRGLVSAVWELGGTRSVAVPMPGAAAVTESAPMPDFEALQTEPEAKPETEAEAKPETESETKPKTEAETEADSKQLLEDAREIVRAHAKTHRAEVKKLLAEYKARKASEVPPEALPEFIKRLKELTAA